MSGALRAALVVVAVASAGAARAHPIEPLVTEAPMPPPRDAMDASLGYRASHSFEGVAHDLDLELAIGVGDRGELAVGGGLDASAGTIGPVSVGGRILLAMEGATDIDLALAVALASDGSGEGSVLVGRSLAPHLYLQARASALAEAAPGPSSAKSSAAELAAALQWAPIPRVIPTLEAQYTHDFAEDADALLVVPEAVLLLDMNHLALKLGVVIGVLGDTDVGLLAALDWQG